MSNGTETQSLTLEADVIALAKIRERKKTLKDQLDAARSAWEEANRHLFEAVEQAEADEKEAYTKLAASIVTVFELTGEKKPHPAAETKITDEPVFDALDAQNWARTYMPWLFVFDSKAYGKMLRVYHESKTLRDVLPAMPGDMSAKPKAYVSADLSAYLGSAAESVS